MFYDDYYDYDSDDGGEVALLGRDRELQNAVLYKKDLAAAQRAIAAGANVNAREDYEGTILQAAVRGGDAAIVRLLLSHGAEINAHGSVIHGSALSAAAQGARVGDTAILKLLLEYDACPNNGLPAGHTFGPAAPLQIAAESVNTEAVKLLLRYGANINAIGGMYGTALQAACHYGHEPTVRALLEAGADVNLQGGYHGDALQAAARYGRAGLVQILLDAGADPTAQCGVYGSALKGAKERGHPEVATMLEAAIEKRKKQTSFWGYVTSLYFSFVPTNIEM